MMRGFLSQKNEKGVKSVATMNEILTPEGIRESFGIACETNKIALMLQHMRILMQTNATLNLTRICEEEEMKELHIWDSLTALPSLASAPDGVMVDLGTGGGYPGIPLAIATGRKTVLLDSVKKKVAAVTGFVRELGLESQISTCDLRAEEYAIEHPGESSAVIARAVTTLAALIELSSPLLMQNGQLIALKGVHDMEEEEKAVKCAGLCGMSEKNVYETTLPCSGQSRTIYVFEKTGEPTIKLPRRNGMAQKKPLV